MKDRTRRGESVQVTEASLIATQKKGRGFVPQNGHAGLFFESDLCSCLFSPPPPSRQEQNKLFLLWQEEEKMCSVIRSLTASRANRKDSHQEQACKVFVGVCLCVSTVLYMQVRAIRVCVC